MKDLLDMPCSNGRSNFFNDEKCRRSICIDCIISAEYQTDDIEPLDTYGVALVLNDAIPLDFSTPKNKR